MTDAEQIEAWRKEFEQLIPNANLSKHPEGDYVRDPIDAMWRGFLMAKRSQPVIELPKECSEHYTYDMVDLDDVKKAITAAVYKYKVKS